MSCVNGLRDRILKVGRERHHLFGVEALVDHLMKRFALDEVLIVDVARLCWIDPQEIVLPSVFCQCVAQQIS